MQSSLASSTLLHIPHIHTSWIMVWAFTGALFIATWMQKSPLSVEGGLLNILQKIAFLPIVKRLISFRIQAAFVSLLHDYAGASVSMHGHIERRLVALLETLGASKPEKHLHTASVLLKLFEMAKKRGHTQAFESIKNHIDATRILKTTALHELIELLRVSDVRENHETDVVNALSLVSLISQNNSSLSPTPNGVLSQELYSEIIALALVHSVRFKHIDLLFLASEHTLSMGDDKNFNEHVLSHLHAHTFPKDIAVLKAVMHTLNNTTPSSTQEASSINASCALTFADDSYAWMDSWTKTYFIKNTEHTDGLHILLSALLLSKSVRTAFFIRTLNLTFALSQEAALAGLMSSDYFTRQWSASHIVQHFTHAQVAHMLPKIEHDRFAKEALILQLQS